MRFPYFDGFTNRPGADFINILRTDFLYYYVNAFCMTEGEKKIEMGKDTFFRKTL